MAIVHDIERLGLKLDEIDRTEIDAIVRQVEQDHENEFKRAAIIEFLVEEYLAANRPDILDTLKRERTRSSEELYRQAMQRFDASGRRICDESSCTSTDGVAKCAYCEKYVCRRHNYSADACCCYACWKEHFEGKG